jgi:hypothetical protein
MHYGDQFTGFGFRLWASGEQTLLSNELCMQFLGQFIMGISSRDSGFASGCPGSKHCSAMNCVHSFGSMHHGERFTGFRVPLWASGEQILLSNELINSFGSMHYGEQFT